MKQTVYKADPRANQWRSSRWIRVLPAITCMIVIFILSAQPGSELDTVFLPWFQQLFPAMEGFDWGHYIAYFGLGVTFDWMFGSKYSRLAACCLIVLACTLYGLTDEVHQLFVKGRTFDLHDLLHDAVGAAAAALLLSIPAIRSVWNSLLR
ncbi:VanZ family protein [Paenibacillus curdlanolyticus YK9]|uniref:VanZ family protein n=1 Tax=Paenibacillus curdlanolyticus YK9 TaxID=717606 RepID=E0I3P2_9BACL|nr:VanZ family protein [Paenibacillus curdlanolyticus]EFM12906.1 VanZ family protein [Paenibacillus curdlanolyticus YK9]